PAADESNVLISSSITIDFNRIMNKASVESAFVIEPNVDGTFSWTNNESQLIFSPASNLEGKTEYRVSIDSTARDLNGKTLNSIYRFSFITVRTKLELITHYPATNDINVSTKPDLIFKFDASLDQNSLAGNVLFVDEENKDVPIYVDHSAYANGMLRFEPQNYLDENKNYKVILKSGVADTGGLTFDEEIEINFIIEADKYISGNVIDDFETDADWVDPKDAEGSIGIDLIGTEFSLSQIKKRNGSYSGMLEYKFKGVDAVCRVYNSAENYIGMNKQFGIWVFGDFSNNILEYWFTDSQSQIIKTTVDTIDWTGWKLKTVDLSEIAGNENIQFNSIVIKQNNSGDISGILYFDDI
ncbi:MAG: Ig-like domain-containing protein, partial [Melioribacteraceae bacterium]|nr:Ig-like domain-containing protein [Melioribacteraceae bacterium]